MKRGAGEGWGDRKLYRKKEVQPYPPPNPSTPLKEVIIIVSHCKCPLTEGVITPWQPHFIKIEGPSTYQVTMLLKETAPEVFRLIFPPTPLLLVAAEAPPPTL